MVLAEEKQRSCIFWVDGRCIVGLQCSYLDISGNVHCCPYLPNSRGRFTLKKRGSNVVNPVVLSPSKFVRRRCL